MKSHVASSAAQEPPSGQAGGGTVMPFPRSPVPGKAGAARPGMHSAAGGEARERIGRIRVKDVAVCFSGRAGKVVALDQLSCDIEPGEFVALLGPSGCGKSTLLNVIAGIVTPSDGEVQIDGAKVTEPSPRCGVVFQHHSLFPWMSVLKNVAFGPEMLGHPDPTGTARTLLSLVGLEPYADAWPSTLSGGMQQRVSIARALATYPPVLLMDEPFGALDAQTRSIMQEELLKLWSTVRTTVVFVTHDIDEAIFLADRVIVMRTLPGGIKTAFPIDLPRPRDTELLQSPQFNEYRKAIFQEIREETLKVFNAGV